MLLTTHYMEEADQLCDRVAIMDHGQILALDTPAASKQSVGADTIVRSRRPATSMGSAGALTAGSATASIRSARRGAVHLLVARDRCSCRARRSAEAGGFVISDIQVSEPTLETVFINLTGKELRE